MLVDAFALAHERGRRVMTRTTSLSSVPNRAGRRLVAILCVALLVPGETVFLAQATPPAAAQDAPAEAKLPPEQLDALVAPIALYPDPLLGQVLVAATYPLEIVQLQQWLAKNKGLKDKALTDTVAKQPWDPSIQSMAALPDVVKRLGDDIQWTTELGNAFLAQQADVMDAVQRMRKKAEGTGALKSNEQQKVETKVVEQKTVIVVEQANPEVVYVPSYNPVVVYGPPYYAYPYPPIYYPPSTGAVVAASMISFGVGIAIGAAWGHGGWGYGCGWGHNDININVNNNFQRNTNINRSGNTNWSHNPQHRGGAPYANRSTANKYGGTARGDSLSSRQTSARQQTSRGAGGAGAGAQSAGAGARAGASDRSGARSGSPAVSSQSSRGGGASGGGDRVGSRDVGASRSSGGSSAFGSSSGYSGSSARASSARGSSSARGGSRSGGGGGGRRR
jgi:Protein of unknown function (DUF3300)